MNARVVRMEHSYLGLLVGQDGGGLNESEEFGVFRQSVEQVEEPASLIDE